MDRKALNDLWQMVREFKVALEDSVLGRNLVELDCDTGRYAENVRYSLSLWMEAREKYYARQAAFAARDNNLARDARVALGDAELQSYTGKKASGEVVGYPCRWNEVVCAPLKFDWAGYPFDLL